MVRLRERKIDLAWLEQAITQPERTEPDPDDPALEHRLAAIANEAIVFYEWYAIRGQLR